MGEGVEEEDIKKTGNKKECGETKISPHSFLLSNINLIIYT